MSRKSEDATATVISMLEENMRHLEDMEEEKIRMQQEHEDEKLRLEEQMEQIVDQWLEQKARLEESMLDEKQQMRKEMEDFRAQCEKAMAEEKAEMARQMQQCREELLAETERMACEKVQMVKEMEAFRTECSQKMTDERAQMSRKTADFEAECNRSMAEKEAEMARKLSEHGAERTRLEQEKEEMRRRMDEFSVQCERQMAAEKENMGRQTAAFQAELDRKLEEHGAERARLEQEKEEMRRRMDEFSVQCERQMAAEKEAVSRQTADFQAECESKMKAKEEEMAEMVASCRAECEEMMLAEKEQMEAKAAEFRAEHRRLEEEKTSMISKMEEFRAESEEKMAFEKALISKEIAEFQAECQRLEEEKRETMRKMAAFRQECEERMAQEKLAMTGEMCEFRTTCEKKIEDNEFQMSKRTSEWRAERERLAQETSEMTRKFELEKAAMGKRTAEFFAECQLKMEENEAEMNRKTTEFRAERQRMAEEKAAMTRQMKDFRSECEQKIKEEEAATQKMTAEVRAESERKVAEEKAASERRLAETRRKTEEQLRTERQITNHIMNVLRELPPLQTAMELGDLGLLEMELTKWKGEILPERFGEGKGVVEAVVKLARERLVTWRGVEHTWKDVLRQVERLPGGVAALTQQCQRLFRAIKEAQLTKMDLQRSDPQAIDRICEVFLVWQERAMANSNGVQRAIVRKVVTWPQLGPFDFADMDICLRLVDRGGAGSDVFLSRAEALVTDEATAPKEFRGLLSHVETMLFFLKYAASEDLSLAHAEFRKQAGELEPTVAGYLAWTERRYPPGSELVRLPAGRGLMDRTDVSSVLEEIRKPPSGVRADGLGPFREIFYQWAVAMRGKFDLLVLPHHTQVVCLLAFQRFLEAERTPQTPHALIAQVGTGEGKSMIIAALAIYVVTVLGKKAHVVVDDETLLERDFWTFKRLFDIFQVPCRKTGARRPLVAVLCTSEEKVAEGGDSCCKARVDPDADVCYCEAKHVQSFYASVARGENRDFDAYKERVLILDEVDALVIDEEPNEAFVYPNQELSQMATSVAEALAHGNSAQDLAAIRGSQHPAANRVIAEMTKEWARGKQFTDSEDFVYSRELGRYCALHAGRANPKAWSLALECRNFQDGLSREILFQERLFVMSRPRVFRRYHRILGLSGSIGSQPERKFLKETYRATFFEVPPFLKTCRGSPFHEPVPMLLGEQKRAVYVETTPEAHLKRLAEVALEARERVPVLVIARDRNHADQVVEGLRQAARSRGLGNASEDVVRSLSRTLYEADPEQWKENLNRATLPLGDREGVSKSWRVTVTDPRGGRGTDYRVDDPTVDEQGGLLLIPTMVPTSQREWTQFLGRTARQDRKGQFCCVLNSSDYESLTKKYGEALPSGGGLEVIKKVLSWGDRQVSDRIKGSAALYNCGVRMNELCEEIFGHRSGLLRDPLARERLVDVCQRHRWMSVREVGEAFARVPGMDPATVPTEAIDLGRPAEPPAVGRVSVPGALAGKPAANGEGPQEVAVMGQPGVPKVVIFALDWSCSMLSRDTRTPLNRFETCVKCVQRILQDQVREDDLVGVVCFGPKVEVIVQPTPKSVGGRALASKIQTLRPQTAGGTTFFDAVAQCLQMMHRPGQIPSEALKWLVCLTDGDDLGSRRENMRGELVTQMLNAGIPRNLNMVVITVGQLRANNVKIIDGWVEQVAKSGGLGKHVSEKDAAAIAKAFDVVAECLATEVGGATEC